MDGSEFDRLSGNAYPRLQFGTCAVAIMVLLIAAAVSASPTGSIVGFVNDPSGSVVSGAKLTLTNAATNPKMEAVTDANGEFQFLPLVPAIYSLGLESQGLQNS